ncbi:MAG: DeoR/GlpR family DNA-binding transcription regulator [Bacilli bacterium]
MRINRLDQIEQYVKDNKSAKLDDLCIIFKVSKNTIRRDIDVLVQRGSIKKVYGGVINISDDAKIIPFKTRIDKDYEFKCLAAKKAAMLIEEDDVIFIDSGSTTVLILDYIKAQHITIITHNVEVLSKAFNHSDIDVIMLPGKLNRDTNSIADVTTVEELLSYNINKAFIASSGLSLNNGVTNFYLQEAEIKKGALKKSITKILVVDHTKFDNASLVTFAQINDFDYVISDEIPVSYQEYFTKSKIHYQ